MSGPPPYDVKNMMLTGTIINLHDAVHLDIYHVQYSDPYQINCQQYLGLTKLCKKFTSKCTED